MSGYGEALRAGLAAHEQARRARDEMDEVLAEASREVTDVLNADISLQFQLVDRPLRAEAVGDASARPLLREQITALTARTGHGSFEILAEARFGEAGYPITLRWGSEFETVHDRVSFEEVVRRLLGRGATGAKLASLARRSGPT